MRYIKAKINHYTLKQYTLKSAWLAHVIFNNQFFSKRILLLPTEKHELRLEVSTTQFLQISK